MTLIHKKTAGGGPSHPAAPAAARRPKRIIIVGLPNSGKSQLWNSLTGAYDLVSNYPQTTVEVATHRSSVEGEAWEVTDTPGLHGLYIQSEEELVVRDLLFSDPPDVLVQCVDAHRLRESLLLTSDLLGLGIPLVLVLTAVGESAQRGVHLDVPALSQMIGVPVIPSPAPGAGVSECRRALLGTLSTPRAPSLGDPLESAIDRIGPLLPGSCPFPRASALLLLENDPSFNDFLTSANGSAADHATAVEAIRTSLAGTAPLLVSSRRNQWVDRIAARVTDTTVMPNARLGFSETFARLCRHPLYGLPILAFFLGVIYLMVVYVAGTLSLFLTTTLTDPVVAAVGRLLPAGFWKDLLIGQHGLLTLGLFNSLTTVLPILSVFFLFFGLLEDIGYLPNLAILTRRISEKIGITGNAVIPLVLGFGCKTVATMTARTLQSRKEKLIVIALIAFGVPCSAQMGMSIAILGQHGIRYFLIAFGFLALAEVIAGLLLNRLLPDDSQSQFIQELPPIRLPRVTAVARKTGYRLLWFLREAIPIFLIAALAMFAIDELGLLALLKHALSPVITGWLGLPLDMVDALLLTLARSEAAAGMVLRMSQQGKLNGVQSVVAVLLLTTFAQCFANIAAMFKEVGARAAIIIVVAIYVAAFAYTGAVHEVLALTAGVLGL
ncbi:MAG: ferrous iron transporter B [Spirochaetia bacterium]|jgi:ferrous iron transport protein B